MLSRWSRTVTNLSRLTSHNCVKSRNDVYGVPQNSFAKVAAATEPVPDSMDKHFPTNPSVNLGRMCYNHDVEMRVSKAWVTLLLTRWMKDLEKIFYRKIVAYDAVMLPNVKQDELPNIVWRKFFSDDGTSKPNGTALLAVQAYSPKMATRVLQCILWNPITCRTLPTTQVRWKTSSAHYVASRARDPTFEKFMDKYKNFLKVLAIHDLILASPQNPQSIPLEFLSKLSQKIHLNRGPAAFLRQYPHVFCIFYDPAKCQPLCRLTDTAIQASRLEAAAIESSLPLVVDRLVRILSMSVSKSVPLRAIFKVWRELGLPDDFEDSVILKNNKIFKLVDGNEPNTHVLKLLDEMPRREFTPQVEKWRARECCREACSVDETEIKYNFKHGFPPGMRLSKDFKAKVKDWQRLPYKGPYEEIGEKRKSKSAVMQMEKRAVAVVHEFLSLTVEKMVEVEKISHFRNCFGIDLNIRDLFLDHPGIFYLSTKGKRHTVFLREAYERGCLIEPNPVYDARRKLLELVLFERRGLPTDDSNSRGIGQKESRHHEDNND